MAYFSVLNKLRNKTLIAFLTCGYSLDFWFKVERISNEVKIYNKLSEYFKKVYFITYGDISELNYKSYLNKNIRILFNYLRLPLVLYSLFVPIIYRHVFREAAIYRTHQLWGSWTAIIAKLLYRGKLVVRQGYQLSKFAKRQGARAIRRLIIAVVEFFAYHLADRIIVTSSSDKEYIVRRYRVNPAKIVVIPNYVNTELFRPINNAVKEGRRIAFVGRLDPQKNLPALIDAVKGLNIELLIIGDGPLRRALEGKVERENIRNVKFLGIIPNEKLPQILNSCEAFVLPSLYEGNPKSLLEAMACGLPVIAANVEGVREIVNHGETGLLCGTDSNSIRAAILQLLKDKDLRDRIGRNARLYVEANYALDKIVRSELATYLSLMREQL